MAENKQHVLAKQQQRIAPWLHIESSDLAWPGPGFSPSGETPGRGRGKHGGLLRGLGRALGSQRPELDRKGGLGCDESCRASRNSTPGSRETLMLFRRFNLGFAVVNSEVHYWLSVLQRQSGQSQGSLQPRPTSSCSYSSRSAMVTRRKLQAECCPKFERPIATGCG